MANNAVAYNYQDSHPSTQQPDGKWIPAAQAMEITGYVSLTSFGYAARNIGIPKRRMTRIEGRGYYYFLTPQNEAVLKQKSPQFRKADYAYRDMLVEKHYGMINPVLYSVIRYVGWRIVKTDIKDELTSAGHFGLLDAASRYDPSRNVKFETFAVLRIRGQMLDALMGMAPLPRITARQMQAIAKAEESLELRLGSSPSQEEVANHLGMGVKRIGTIKNRAEVQSSISNPVGLINGADEVINQPYFQTPLDDILREESNQAVRLAVAQLNPRLQKVINMRYQDEMLLAQIGKQMGFNESRASQLHAKAISKLRSILKASLP